MWPAMLEEEGIKDLHNRKSRILRSAENGKYASQK